MSEINKTKTFQIELDEADKLIHEASTDFFAMRVAACKNDMELHISAIPYQKDKFITPERLLAIFGRLNISGDIDNDAISDFCTKVSQGETMEGVVAARGKQPENGQNQKQIFHAKPMSAVTDAPETFDEKKDYHSLNLFENVNKNQLIAETVAATEGIAGKTVLGEYISAEPGKRLKQPLRPGPNVTSDDSGVKFYAKLDGMVIYDRRTQVISVSDTYTIKGNVDYTTGDIDFIGDVEVSGDVTDSYNITAGGSLTVSQHVGNSKICCGGDITLHGVDGAGEGCIKSKGNVSAVYLHGVEIECDGDIIISTEAVNSKLHSEKSILAKTGAIIGGEAVALKGFEVQTIGTEAQARTHIISGVSYIMQEAISNLREQLNEFKTQMDVMTKKLDPFITNPRNLLSLNDAGRQKIKDMAKEFKEVVAKKDELEHELQQLSKESLHGANPMVSIVKSIEPEVVITIGTSTEKFTERVVGQQSFIENSINGGLRPVPYYPIDKSARDIEYAIVRELKKKKEKEANK